MIEIGYSVYFQEDHHRWAGYGVPGVCDHPKCGAHVMRGLAEKCEEHLVFAPDDIEEEDPISTPGCDLFFCPKHQGEEFMKHWDWNAKPDTKRWYEHMLNDDTWAIWRKQHPAQVVMMIKEVSGDD